MNFVHRYFGATSASSDALSTALAFAPDLLREPTYFVGKVRRHLPFREAISALHHVVVSDLRFKPKDRTAYFAWLKDHEEQLLAEAVAERGAVRERIDALRVEFADIHKLSSEIMRPFYGAQKRYFDWLYQNNRDAWFVLDPVITVHPDEVFFECFSLDESTYGRLSCDHDVFERVEEMACGTTNIDYSHALYDEFQKIRSYRDTSLTIEPSGFEVQTAGEANFREEKIDLPDSWMRGFLQVSSAMAQPAHVVDLAPVDMHAILSRLAAKRERHGPRSLRFLLEPDKPVEVLIEPWNDRLTFRRSIYKGSEPAEIRIWGRRRLAILERALPLAKSVRLHLLGSGLPSFAVVDYGGLRFTLGLSGWTANDWSRAGQFDLLAPRTEVDETTAQKVFDALKGQHFATVPELAFETGLDRSIVAGALGLYVQAGRAMYDLDKGVYRLRELVRDPLKPGALRFSSEQEEKADRFVAARLVTIGSVDTREGKRVSGEVMDDGKTHHPRLVIDADDRLSTAACDCWFYGHNKLMRGPCEHMLALRRLYHLEVEGKPRAFRAEGVA
ncbi:SWIM zinc finger family protein [Chenggangzhangella methanolivorans]|uniref:SWIM zinc finger family protein n=1 Tax=Chenggangzhangella methanolivorans TaxID=1437009 RepID=A0A9E6UM99_9HYPH|nr:SWIM zinc finger family protein [Chenggangzhangella methanolivorans]QZN98968.1 SWIM zinc finger family protein [Chenggangzhangella methanolivorans]